MISAKTARVKVRPLEFGNWHRQDRQDVAYAVAGCVDALALRRAHEQMHGQSRYVPRKAARVGEERALQSSKSG
jgi:hypothetical protein